MIKKIIAWTTNESPTWQQLGIAIIRISFGILFFVSGCKKLISGSANMTQIGSAMGLFGITQGYLLLGYIAALTEFFGGISFIIGFCIRITSIPLIWLLIVASSFHIQKGDSFHQWAFPCICLCVTIAFLIAGSGMYSVDHRINFADQE